MYRHTSLPTNPPTNQPTAAYAAHSAPVFMCARVLVVDDDRLVGLVLVEVPLIAALLVGDFDLVVDGRRLGRGRGNVAG